MLKQVRNHFSPAALTLSVLALVLALAGGAIAASGALSGKQKKEVEKIARKFAGKPGAPGTNGSNGVNGKDGAPGAAGKDGASGPSGIDGTSAEAISFSGEKGSCKEGGLEVKSASPTALVCNGAKGDAGPAGPLISVAPSDYTMTGEWATQFSSGQEGNGTGLAPVSFPFPLAAAPAESVFIPSEGAETQSDEEKCPGSDDAPTAEAGIICFYATFEVPGPVSFQTALLSKQGATAVFAGASESSVIGAWAVKAP